ncbi:MAG TPA: phosphoadenosine phosphosulfate reductase family protein [Pyrinomonadaceae bacterium]|nr:phosphoadenosine phosphosulfate reductase family protein [Pyrinomonadaceae bacterium]
MKILTDEITNQYLEQGSKTVVAMSVSGGKDSDVLALELNEYLDSINFQGERVLIHSDLGEIEHSDSLPTCERLAKHLNLPLIVVKPNRPMIERWEYRWECNVERFINLKSVKISTWASSAQWRFCTGEEKTTPICRKLKELFPGQNILNVVGIRGEESAGRAKKPVSLENKLLSSKCTETTGRTWFPIRDYQLEDVFLVHQKHGFALHEAYSKNGNSRVSCVFCVLAGESEFRASLNDPRTHQIYRRLVELEARSTFSFQPNKWLADVAPELLPSDLIERIKVAKTNAAERQLAFKSIPHELLFDKNTGFPSFQPTLEQAASLAEVRRKIGSLLNLEMKYVTAQTVYEKYASLLQEQSKKPVKKSSRIAVKSNSQPTLF